MTPGRLGAINLTDQCSNIWRLSQKSKRLMRRTNLMARVFETRLRYPSRKGCILEWADRQTALGVVENPGGIPGRRGRMIEGRDRRWLEGRCS